MADWSLMEHKWPQNQYDPYRYAYNQYYHENPPPQQTPPSCMQQSPPSCMQQSPPSCMQQSPPSCMQQSPPSCMQQSPPSFMQQPPPSCMQQSYMQPQMPVLSPGGHIFGAPSSPSLVSLLNEPSTSCGLFLSPPPPPLPKPDNPREIRNKAEKQRRDKLNQSIGELASMVPPVVASSRKIDKTGVLRLTAHYLRAHQYVFGDSITKDDTQFSAMSTRALLSILNGFLLTTTYRGLIVVVSQNVQQYLGYTELDLLGQNVFNLIHEGDRQLMKDMLMPKPHMLGPNGELLVPDEPEGKNKVAEMLASEKRRFIIRFKKLCQRSEPCQYATCHIEGSLRKSDRACRGYNRCCQMVRRARARGDNPCSSGNDVVFVGIVRLAAETFITESNMEAWRMEYRTRHSIDGQIIQCEQRISLVTGYMTHEVNGINAMNFMHKDDVRWVVIALREMYDQHRLVGESCYRLLTKNDQFIYMRTRGYLEVDPNTRAVTSFVCTNTVVDEQEGKHLIKLMKKKFMLMLNTAEEPPPEEEVKDHNDQNLSVEDPRQLEKVILHLVTNLPSPKPSNEERGASPDCVPSAGHLAIIPPKKERIVSAIKKIYGVIKNFPKDLQTVRKLRLGKADTTDSSNVASNALITTYHDLPTSHSPQLAIDTTKHLSIFIRSTKNPCSKLPNFSHVYQRQNADSNGSLELSLTKRSPPLLIPNETITTLEAPSTSYSGTTTIRLGNNVDESNHNGQENSIKYRVCVLPTGENKILNEVHNASANNITTGIKRPREIVENTEKEAASKKKNAFDNVTEPTAENVLDTPLLENLFDEELFNLSYSQIHTTISSLAQNLDPTFPELLISEDVQDILHKIEDGATENQPET
uniref:Methoprene-tolerant protein 2 n=1 Tax=Chilo suppressalis TaxID=168631 RepID=A0A7D5SMX3_CHISP|nr:methoprene-tolerant protein 2 [Chilo suppressalis]